MDLKELPTRAFDRHPWEIARATFFLRLLREWIAPGGLRVLDAGAGDGYFAARMLAELPGLREVLCFDPAYDAAWIARQVPRDDRISFSALRPTERCDLVVLLDVLEHADDDLALLKDTISASAAPNAWFLLSAPAYPSLFSRHDQILGHRRRYFPSAFRALAAQAGLRELDHGQLFTSLLLPRALAKLRERTRAGRPTVPATTGHVQTALGSWHHGAMTTSAVSALLHLDTAAARLASKWRLPLPGLSTWLLARLP